MSVTVQYTFSCGGCDACEVGERRTVDNSFVSVSGRNYGIGSRVTTIPDPDPPDGWVAFDPYTGCCYCPKCWQGIIVPDDGGE